MATTEIHAITVTPYKALRYVISDKVVPYISDDHINKDMPYRILENNGEKLVQYLTLNSFQNCDALNPYSTYRDMQEKWQGVRYKNNGKKAKNGQEPLMWHLHQSFNGMEVTPETANEIGRKLAEEIFKGFSVTVSTHCNTDNIHNHFIISAWDNTGKKWNNCNKNYQNIRRVSDRLCEEYGLHVLGKTKDVKLIRYKDKDGNTRYYEPTDRKNELIRKREAGEVTGDDVRSYRNTPIYEKTQKKTTNNRTEIKADIDAVLPTCRSYEELLERLKELGYSIRAKKKNGDWMAHVSFQSPLQDRATREDKIGDGVFYTRENLTNYIKAHKAELERDLTHESNHRDYNGDNKWNKTVPFIAGYEYGITKLSDINNHYKTIRSDSGKYCTVERTTTEKKLIADIRVKDSEVRGLIDTSHLDKLIAEQRGRRRQKKSYLSGTQEQRLVAQIQNSFRCLQYTQQHHIYGYRQIINLYSANKAKYDAAIDRFTKAEKTIRHLKEVLLTPKKLSDLQDKISGCNNNISYILEEYDEDIKRAAQYREVMGKYKIDTPEGQLALEKKVAEFEMRQNTNRGYMADVVLQMSELENCIRTYDRIDSENGNRNVQAMNEFEVLAKVGDTSQFDNISETKEYQKKDEREAATEKQEKHVMRKRDDR